MIKSTHGQGGEPQGLTEKNLNEMEREVLTHLRRAGKEKHTKDMTEAILGKVNTATLLKVRNALRRLVREDFVWRLEKSMYIAADKANGHKKVRAPGMADSGGSLVKRAGASKSEDGERKAKITKAKKAPKQIGLGIPKKAAAQAAEEAEAAEVQVQDLQEALKPGAPVVPGSQIKAGQGMPLALPVGEVSGEPEVQKKMPMIQRKPAKPVVAEAMITRDEKASMAKCNEDCKALFGSSFLDGKVVVAAFHTGGSNSRVSRLIGCAVGYAQRRVDKMGRDQVKAATTLTKTEAQAWLAACRGGEGEASA